MTAMPAGSAVPWAPEDLPIPADQLGSWDYVVVEELVDDVVLLRRWPWPVVDPLGRLLWPDGAEHDTAAAAVDLRLLKLQLYVPNGIARQPRCGDAFAAHAAHPQWRRRRTDDLRSLLGDTEIYDISADAREAGKMAHQASTGAIRAAQAAERESVDEVQRTLRRRAEQQLRPLQLSPPPEFSPPPRPR